MAGASPFVDGPAGRSLLRRSLAGAALLLAGVGLTGCWFRHYEWNQKVTVTVQTPQGEVSGSAVSHIQQTIGTMPMTGNDQAIEFSGEATVVEVRPGTYMFAVIGEESKWIAVKAFRDSIPLDHKDDTYRALERKRDSIALPRNLYPLLVTFGNLNDPASVKEVDPANLAASFGPGYALKSITLEITDEPVTRGVVEKLLPWLPDYFASRLDGERYGNASAANPLANSLSSGSFSTESKT